MVSSLLRVESSDCRVDSALTGSPLRLKERANRVVSLNF
jgi:hypothetical protein